MINIYNDRFLKKPYICPLSIMNAKPMETICHHCKSKEVVFDGELYWCMHCSYMWMPETSLEEYKFKVMGQLKEKWEKEVEQDKKGSPGIVPELPCIR